MNFKNPVIEKLYRYLSTKSREAYKDHLLIANTVLSKQGDRGRILETYLAGGAPLRVSFLLAVKKIFFYFVKNLIAFIFCLATGLLHRLSGQKYSLKEGEGCVFLDTFFVIPRILDKGEFEDHFFPGLSEYLTKRKIEYVYTPKWFGSNNPLQLFRVFNILKKSSAPVLTQFQLLKPADYLDTARFIFLYPFSILNFLKRLGTSYEDKILYGGLWDALDCVAFESHMRYLFARRLVAIKSGKIKCISWYENQVADKNFYRGLRTLPEKTEIIGAQLFARPAALMNQFPDEQEVPFNVVPDTILVNGPGYRFELDGVSVSVGPALRYGHLFNVAPPSLSREVILVVLPHWDHMVRDVLQAIREVDWPKPVKIKFHPTMDWRAYKRTIPHKFSITSEPLQKLIFQAFIVVGGGTGAMLEAASLGVPVVNFIKPKSFIHECMPEIGKGIIWDQANEAGEIGKIITQFQKTLDENPGRLKEEGARLKSLYFAEPTDELIGQAFGLRKGLN